LSFVAPENVHFRFKLEGQDTDWREVVNSRHVEYSNLPPKQYRFLVKASNNNGVWNEEGAFLDFSIAPAYWQTRWFQLCCAVAFVLIVFGLYQSHLRHLRDQFHARLEGRVNERTRIARELHDSLLQSFQGLLYLLDAGVKQLPDRPDIAKVQERLGDAINRGRQAIQEGRDAIQGLRSSSTETNDLVVSLNSLAAELAGNQDGQNVPVCVVQVEGTSRALHPIFARRCLSDCRRGTAQRIHARSAKADRSGDTLRFPALAVTHSR
jgi:hypothetical protein